MSGAANSLSRTESQNEVLNLRAVDLSVQFLIECENSSAVKRAQGADNLFLGDVIRFHDVVCFKMLLFLFLMQRYALYLHAKQFAYFFFAACNIFGVSC